MATSSASRIPISSPASWILGSIAVALPSRFNLHIYIYTIIHTYIYIYVYVYVNIDTAILDLGVEESEFPTRRHFSRVLCFSNAQEIMGTNVSTTYITCPADPSKTLGIKLPFLATWQPSRKLCVFLWCGISWSLTPTANGFMVDISNDLMGVINQQTALWGITLCENNQGLFGKCSWATLRLQMIKWYQMAITMGIKPPKLGYTMIYHFFLKQWLYISWNWKLLLELRFQVVPSFWMFPKYRESQESRPLAGCSTWGFAIHPRGFDFTWNWFFSAWLTWWCLGKNYSVSEFGTLLKVNNTTHPWWFCFPKIPSGSMIVTIMKLMQLPRGWLTH